ncbi:MAG TPA: aldo/keto reductase [Pyrinomonadaceae bacterium]|nr:aldo/keto reductase [Pyrinomonadaceae bacterium]
MKRRLFNNTGEEVSEIGLGTWQLGGADWGEVDENLALETLRAAAAGGVNFFDTADVYGLGRSEEIIGKFLKETPGRIFVATKLGRFPEPGWPENFTLAAMRRHTEASLRRLGVEAVDLTQLHCIPTDVLSSGEVFESLRELKREGKIKHYGVSVESNEEALICLQQEDLASLQIIFNIFRQKPIEFFEEAKRKGVALIVRLPLASGLLSGKFTKGTQFAATDHRAFNREGQAFNVGETFAGLPFEKGVELADALKQLAPEGVTMAQTALRWILDFDAVSVIIPGASNPRQARANVSASDLAPLGAELHARLKEFYEREVAAHIRGPY